MSKEDEDVESVVGPSDGSDNKYQQFNSLEEARHFLNEQKMSGTLGVKIN